MIRSGVSPAKSLIPVLCFCVSQYLQKLFVDAPSLDAFGEQLFGYNEVVQIPLQPLMDNLQNATYDVFEKDRMKYHFVGTLLEHNDE